MQDTQHCNILYYKYGCEVSGEKEMCLYGRIEVWQRISVYSAGWEICPKEKTKVEQNSRLMTLSAPQMDLFQHLQISHFPTLPTNSAKCSGSDLIMRSNSANWAETIKGRLKRRHALLVHKQCQCYTRKVSQRKHHKAWLSTYKVRNVWALPEDVDPISPQQWCPTHTHTHTRGRIGMPRKKLCQILHTANLLTW